MTSLQTIESLLPDLSQAEKVHLLQWVVQDLGDAAPGIESIAGVCGGAACIVRTRIPVWVLEQGRQQGMGDAALLNCYPSLNAEDLTHAWAYVRSHKAEIAQQIQDNTQA